MINDCLIMAGGSGTRLWPLSNSRKPKQFLPASKNETESFFSLSLERALKIVSESDGRVIIICGNTHLPFIITTCSKLKSEEKKRIVLIPEPEAKNTAPAIACAIAFSGKTLGLNRTMLVLTSDHIIKPLDMFLSDASTSAQFAEQNKLVVFGIPPTSPETGFGYIEASEKLSDNVYTAASFKEKPNLETAEQFLASKKYFWNSGMFAFRCNFLTEEYHRLQADLFSPFENLKTPDKKSYSKIKDILVLDKWTGLDKAYKQANRISFDYAIAEKCGQTVMIRSSFDWLDIGSWDDYVRLLSDNSSKEVFSAKADGCFVDSDIPVALAGVENLIVVIRSGKDGSPSSALITQKGKSQLVRDIVENIKQSDRKDIL